MPKSERLKWNSIKKVRNCSKTATSKKILRNSFNEINAYLKEKNLKSEMKFVNVIPLYKKRETDNPTKQRPIYITTDLSFCFEILYEALLEDNLHATNLIINRQYGFWKNLQ